MFMVLLCMSAAHQFRLMLGLHAWDHDTSCLTTMFKELVGSCLGISSKSSFGFSSTSVRCVHVCRFC